VEVNVTLVKLVKLRRLGDSRRKKEEERRKKNPRFKTWDCNKDVLYLPASSFGIIIYFH
jgi:hypothetical protein